MNAEHLHRVALLVWNELESTDAPGLIARLRSGLDTFASSPSDAAAQQTISDTRVQLQQALPDAPSNTLPPVDRQILDEIGISEVLGQRLLDRVEEILTRNEMTPSVALGEIEPINARLAEIVSNIQQLLAALSFFRIGRDDLVDDYEVGVAIPRTAKSTLPELGREFVELQKIFGTFEEVAGQASRPDFEVRALASSDFALFLLASPETALVLAKVLNVIVDTYDKILAIKQKKAEMAELMPEDPLAGVDEYVNKVMADRLTALAAEVVANSNVPEGRNHEVEANVKWSLNRIANRIDVGYTIDIRTPPVPEEEPPEEGEEIDEAAQAALSQAREIKVLADRIHALETGGKRILELPEGTLPDDPGDEPKGAVS